MGRGKLANRLMWASLALAGASMLGHLAFIAAGSPEHLDRFGNLWLYDGAIVFSALACLMRAVASPVLRGAWIAFTAGLLLTATGDAYWTLELADMSEIPYPSFADGCYLLAMPCLFAGVLQLIRHRVRRFGPAQWIDSVTAALATAAIGVALLAPALVDLTSGDPAAVMTNLAYPLWDLFLIAFLAGAIVVTGVRGAGALLLIGAGLLLWTGADALYLYLEATSGYSEGWVDPLWTSGAFLMALSAGFSLHHRPKVRDAYRTPLWEPGLIAAFSVGILIWDHFTRLHEASVWLAGAALIGVATRLAVSFRQTDALLDALHNEATTDALTGLANRRQLFNDLERGLDRSAPDAALTLALFDLDGFKSYNDAFGHPAGDALLRRLGTRLAQSVRGAGSAYRLGGDEFCVLLGADGSAADRIIDAAHEALTARGEGFSIAASSGSAELPDEADSATEALRVVDQRMYAQKAQRPMRVAQQTHQLLLRVVEHEPRLGEHGDTVSRYATRLTRALGLEAEQRDVIHRAAELHDIGKIAIPDEILLKHGPLDAGEWELMRRHTLVGERILNTAPALRPVADIVRASHERWDGSGYPDRLAGDEIPIGARIVFVCDAFDAMTSERSYREPIPEPDAIAELRRNAGSQFDPELVELFARLWEEGAFGRQPVAQQAAPGARRGGQETSVR